MKTRTGLVSNSSSSSFIVVFPKKPESVEEVHKYLFNGVDGELNDNMSYYEVSRHVFNQCNNKNLDNNLRDCFYKSISDKLYYLNNEIRGGKMPIEALIDYKLFDDATLCLQWIDLDNKYHSFDMSTPNEDRRNVFEAQDKILNQLVDKEVKEFEDNHVNWWYTVFTFSDDSHIGSILEHGDIFRHVEHIVISNH